MQDASRSDAPWDPAAAPLDDSAPFDPESSTSVRPDGPTEVENLILGLAAQEATGCLTVVDGAGEEGLVWFRDGQVYAASVPGPRPLLGVRLVTAGAISPEQLNEALKVQRTEQPASRLGEVLVHMGLVNRRVVENFALEQQRDMLAELLGWRMTSHWFRNGAHTRTDLAPFTEVVELIKQAHLRQEQWPLVVEEIGGRDVVPISTGTAPQAELTGSEGVVLSSVDGVRTLGDIADACGYTVFEAADVLLGLMAAGLVTTARDLLDQSSWLAPAPDQLADVLELHPLRPEPTEPDVPELTEPDVPELEARADEAPSALPYLPLPPPSAAPFGQPAQAPGSSPATGPVPVAVPVAVPFTVPATGPIHLPPAAHIAAFAPPAADSTEPAPQAPAEPTGPVEPADTAALLRELTSLGDLGNR